MRFDQQNKINIMSMPNQRDPDKKLVAAFVSVKTKAKIEREAKKRDVTVSHLLRDLIYKCVGR